ncbi:MAG: PAC2 family protein [Pseudonocardiales bacterium]|nr:PAC2 family protein [Pseudonocardiales bacterium]MBV9030667.1 PAC2 family protein [Pseudonocardiales bacterium]
MDLPPCGVIPAVNAELYRIKTEPSTRAGTVLVHALTGFVDAGQAGHLAVAHLLANLEHRVVATFDVDQLLDYRSRRPAMIFDEDRWAGYERPELVLYEVRDRAGTPFLLLTGPEPDLQWERFAEAVRELVERFGVGLTVGLGAVPMAVPHTRPATVTAHATRRELISGYQRWFTTMQVPGHAGALVEFRLGETGHDAMGFAVHVPHYLARIEYPESARGLLEHLTRSSGLDLPVEALRPAAQRVLAEINEQIARSPESMSVVAGLEAQFDALASKSDRRPLPSIDVGSLPSGDEIAAEFEQFLAEQDDGQAES